MHESQLGSGPQSEPMLGRRTESKVYAGVGKVGQASRAPGVVGLCERERKRERSELGHFCGWPSCCNEDRPCSTATQPLEHAAVRGDDGATTRQIARRSGRCRARNSANARRTGEGIRITIAQ